MRFGAYTPWYPKPDPETEKLELKNQADALQAEMDAVQQRLSEIESAMTAK